MLEFLPPTHYVRPALGNGFLGAFTTFSSFATATDQLLAHGHPGLAVGYAAGSLFGGVMSYGPHLELSVLVSEGAHVRHLPLYSEIVHRGTQAGLAGASVFRGVEGFGHTHQVHESRVFDFAGHTPMVVVIIDTETRVRDFLSGVQQIVGDNGLVLCRAVEMIAPADWRR